MRSIPEIVTCVRDNMHRVAALGNWPSHIDPEQALLQRIPVGNEMAPGFDAGLACAMNVIPLEQQRLSAKLHAAYTPGAVEQVLREAVVDMDPYSQTCWWLAACSVCDEGNVNASGFLDQLRRFKQLRQYPILRREVALKTLAMMRQSFELIDGVPFAIKDGGMQGAYLAGYDWAVQYSPKHRIFFIGTFQKSLGLENFKFADRVDDQGRTMSGLVHGSPQLAKVSGWDEFAHAIMIVKLYFQKLESARMATEDAMLADAERQRALEDAAELERLRRDPIDRD